MMKTALLSLILSWLPCLSWAASPKPNIIIFLVDDMGVMDTSLPFLTDPSGTPQRHPLNDFYCTPQMGRLAGRGIRFNNFCAMSVCSPTRASILTGQNAARHRTTNWINPEKNNAGPQGPPQWHWRGLKKGDVTLPGLLRENGYRTIHVGKGHFGPRGADGADPANLGFDINIGGTAHGQPGSYYGMKNYGAGAKAWAPGVPGLEKYHGTEVFLTEALTLEANARMEDAVNEEKPFFLHFAHYAVHSPFDSDPRFAANYNDSGKSAKAQAFATLIEGMDKSLGDVLDHLEKLGVAENTLIFFLGDNGSDAPLGQPHEVASSAPLRGMKGSHYEGGMRVPFIAAWARPDAANPLQKQLPIAAGAIQSQQAAVQDLFPTILDLTGTRPPDSHTVDGVKLGTLLAGKTDPARTEQFLMHYPHSPHRSDLWTSWRDGEWKVIYHYVPSEKSENTRYQLYHLKADPSEQKNLASSNPEQLALMMRGLVADLEKHQALYPKDRNGGSELKPQLPAAFRCGP
ncbi:MAG: sulfatase [Akkermansiaceae bacterium]